MIEATLLIKDDVGVRTFHAHSFSDDFQDILVQLEDQFLYGNSEDNEPNRKR